MRRWSRDKFVSKPHRNNRHTFGRWTGVTPWHGGGLGAVRLYIYIYIIHYLSFVFTVGDNIDGYNQSEWQSVYFWDAPSNKLAVSAIKKIRPGNMFPRKRNYAFWNHIQTIILEWLPRPNHYTDKLFIKSLCRSSVSFVKCLGHP